MELSVMGHSKDGIRSRNAKVEVAVFLCACTAVFGLLGCLSPVKSSEEIGALDRASASASVRWATGFGFSSDHSIMWVVNETAGDTTFWTRSGSETNGEQRLNRLPQASLKLATWSTTHVPFVLALGGENQWVGSGYLSRVRRGNSKGQMDLGGDAGLSEEALLACGANVLTSYPFGDPMVGVESRTGIPVLAFSEYAEPHALGRAEYIKLFGWLLNRSLEADSLFDGIEARYLALVTQAKRQADESGWPVVFTGSESGGEWTAPTEDGLVAKMVGDAGGAYAFSAETAEAYGLRRVGANYEVQLEQCALIAKDCDAWGRVVYAKEGWTMSDVQAEAPWCDFSSKLVFHCNTAEVDYFGEAVLQPDRMLGDLISVLHPKAAVPSETPYFQLTRPSK